MNHSPSKDQEPSTASAPFVGSVIGTEDATPLELWAALAPGRTLQLDDVVALERTAAGRDPIRIYGIVTQIRRGELVRTRRCDSQRPWAVLDLACVSPHGRFQRRGLLEPCRNQENH